MEIVVSEEVQRACRLGDVEVLRKIFEEDPEAINQSDSKLKWSPLYRTVICGHLEATKYLLTNGADPNFKNSLGETPLHQAAENSQLKLLNLLLKHKADPNCQQNGKIHSDGSTPLHRSAFKGDAALVLSLLSSNADPNLQNFTLGRTALHYAVEYCHEEVVKLLLDFSADPTIKDNSDRTPLDIASSLIKSLIISSPRSPINTDRYLYNSFLLAPAGPLEYISIRGSENELKSSTSADVLIMKPSISSSTAFEAEAEKANHEVRPSKSFSFGNGGRNLASWLEAQRLDEIFEDLMNAGYDDIDQMASQMVSDMPITEECLLDIGISKSGYRKRLLMALEEENCPCRSSRFTNRASLHGSLGCCLCAPPVKILVPTPSLEQWLSHLGMQESLKLFVDSGYGELGHLLSLMNSRWGIDEDDLKEIGIKDQVQRCNLLARLKADAKGFCKAKGGVSSRSRKEGILIEQGTNATACSCGVF